MGDPLAVLAGVLTVAALAFGALAFRARPGATYETVDRERVLTRRALLGCAFVCLVGAVWALTLR